MCDFRAIAREGLAAVTIGAPGGHAILAEDVDWYVSAPIGHLRGAEAVRSHFLAPLSAALVGVHRRDELFIGGANRRAVGGDWVACLTHYVGTFAAPLFGVPPNGRLIFLRSGEFFRIRAGQIVEARIILDLIDLARQAGRMPLPPILGTEMLFPGPATHDGVLPGDRHRGSISLDLVEAMLTDLHAYDPQTMTSNGQTGEGGYWHRDMLWYGPGGIGSTFRWDRFETDHRRAFLTAFPDRKGGNHYCRIGDGDYAAVSGWPSMTMTHHGDYLGVPATGKALTLRVMDFYRCANGTIRENWVLLDYVDLFDQLDIDVIEIAAAGQQVVNRASQR